MLHYYTDPRSGSGALQLFISGFYSLFIADVIKVDPVWWTRSHLTNPKTNPDDSIANALNNQSVMRMPRDKFNGN